MSFHFNFRSCFETLIDWLWVSRVMIYYLTILCPGTTTRAACREGPPRAGTTKSSCCMCPVHIIKSRTINVCDGAVTQKGSTISQVCPDNSWRTPTSTQATWLYNMMVSSTANTPNGVQSAISPFEGTKRQAKIWAVDPLVIGVMLEVWSSSSSMLLLLQANYIKRRRWAYASVNLPTSIVVITTIVTFPQNILLDLLAAVDQGLLSPLLSTTYTISLVYQEH